MAGAFGSRLGDHGTADSARGPAHGWVSISAQGKPLAQRQASPAAESRNLVPVSTMLEQLEQELLQRPPRTSSGDPQASEQSPSGPQQCAPHSQRLLAIAVTEVFVKPNCRKNEGKNLAISIANFSTTGCDSCCGNGLRRPCGEEAASDCNCD